MEEQSKFQMKHALRQFSDDLKRKKDLSGPFRKNLLASYLKSVLLSLETDLSGREKWVNNGRKSHCMSCF